MSNPKQEAEKLVGALFEKYSNGKSVPWIECQQSVSEMKAAESPAWREVEWPGHYIKYLLQNYCEQNPDCGISPYDDKKRHLVKGDFLWDARVHDFKKNEIPLGDVREYNDLISSSKGIGVILVNAEILSDKTGKIKDWHETLKGKSSEYSIKGNLIGRKERPRKERIRIKQASAYFFQPNDLQTGISEGWATDRFQSTMKNATNPKRNKKYEILKSKIPSKYLLFTKDF